MLIEIIIALVILGFSSYIFYKNIKKKSKGCCSSSGCTANCEACRMGELVKLRQENGALGEDSTSPEVK